MRPANLWIGATVLAAAAVGAVAAWQWDRWGDGGSKLPEPFQYDLQDYEKTDPRLVLYRQTAEWSPEVGRPRAVAVDAEDRVYVAGDGGIRVLRPDGQPNAAWPLESAPYCLAVAGPDHARPGAVYVGLDKRIAVLDREGKPAGGWDLPGEKGRPTSIALAPRDVFVADFAGQVVYRFDPDGKLLGRIGQADKARGVPGLAIPSPFCDVAVDGDGLLWVVNPGALRLQAFAFDGRMEFFWGEAKTKVDGFFGCCNPANFCILPDGRFVTAEKGLLRVKVYSPHGEFQGVVAGPEHLDSPAGAAHDGRFEREHKAVDVAADSRGRVLVLDLTTGKLRVFEAKKDKAAEKS